MMDSKDLEAEIHPLKNEDGKLQENLENPAKKEDHLKSTPVRSRLSGCRTAVFFLSLFICLLVVFVISFIIPCPDRPASQTWRIDYNTAGFSLPCTFVAAVSGANGSVLWERPAAQDAALVECAVPRPRDSGASSACILVGRPGPFIAVDSFTGQTLWNRPSSLGRNVSILSPLLQVPDLDADGAPDLLVLAQEGKEVTSYIYSGSTGHQIGHQGSLGVDGASGSLLHVTREGAHYILLPCGMSASLSEAMLVSHERCTLERAEYEEIHDLPEARRLLRLF